MIRQIPITKLHTRKAGTRNNDQTLIRQLADSKLFCLVFGILEIGTYL